MNRLELLGIQLECNQTAGAKGNYAVQKSKNKLDWFKHNGWGYKDTEIVVKDDGNITVTGSRYEMSGQNMPKFKDWAERVAGIDMSIKTPAQEQININPPIINEGFMKDIENKFDEISFDKGQRILHSHGHSLQESFILRYGQFERTVDCVVFINSNDQAELIVKFAMQHDVVLMPYGGGTNVTWALQCKKDELRMIISVDVTRMNHVKWVDRKNMCALVECGILGSDLEKELSRYGVLCGHEPDSVEFSSLGGWISTRASGMKKNRYGNIEDIVLQVKVVTPTGVYSKSLDYPRVSSGPDINQLVMGSEGILGIITEAVIKIRPLPKLQVFDSIIFHNFNVGVNFMYDVAQSRVWPASLRLVDNNQFQFGMALKTAPKDKTHELMDKAKKYFITQVMKFDPDQMGLATVVFEGSEEEVAFQQKKLYSLCKKHNGFRAGAENGQRGYFLTFMIAYIRDYAAQFAYIAESFETSCSWTQVPTLCENVKNRVLQECKKHKVSKDPFISFRVTQVYDTGAAVYVYFGFPYHGVAEPVKVFTEIEDAAREEIMNNGGSISHHHGVGKLRKPFLEKSIGDVGVDILKKIKQQIDPKNIFGNGNLI